MKKEKLNKNSMIQSSNGSYVQLLRSNTSARSETGTPTKNSHIHPERWYSLKGSQREIDVKSESVRFVCANVCVCMRESLQFIECVCVLVHGSLYVCAVFFGERERK